jgi:uncharacterized membrane protein
MKAVLFAVLAGVCWGVGELLTKSVLHSRQVGPMAILLVRMSVALPPALIAYLIAVKVIGSESHAWVRADGAVLGKLVLGSGLLAGFAGVFFFYLGLAHGQISVVKPIAFTLGPAVAVVLAWVFLKEEMNVPKAAGVVMVLAGVVLISGFGQRTPAGAPTLSPAAAEPN